MQDSLIYGLNIEELKMVLYHQYELIKNEQMKKEVFITGLASFFPNSPVSNDEIEDFWGLFRENTPKYKELF